MRNPKLLLRVMAVFVLAMAFGLVAGAQSLPFTVSWQGVNPPVPNGAQWMAECTLNGKVYLFGGLSSTAAESSLTLGTTQIYDPSTQSWTMGADMPTARYLATAVAVDGKIYVMGGRTINSMGSGGPVNANEVYDPSLDTWSTAKSVPSSIRGHAACAYNGKVYVFGGNTGSYQRTVRIYDPATDSWSTGASMPAARAYGAAFYVPSASRIYYIGGDNGGSTSAKYYDTAITYDPAADSWDSGTIKMKEGVSSPGAAFDEANGLIYIFSGTDWDTTDNQDYGSSIVYQVLDTASNTFTELGTLPPSPITRDDSSAAFIDGKVYVFGGTTAFALNDVYDTTTQLWYQPNTPLAYDAASQNSHFLEMGNVVGANGTLCVLNGFDVDGAFGGVDLYDPATNQWSSSASSNPVPRYGAVADAWDGKVAMADGVDDGGDMTGDAEVYDPVADTFTPMTADPNPTVFASGGVVNGKLYVFGGYDGHNNVATARALDLTADSWSTLSAMPTKLDEACGAAYGGKIYIFGGIIDRDTSSMNTGVIIYDPATDTYSNGADMPAAVYGASAAVYGDYIIVYGGDNLYKQLGSLYYRNAPFLQVYDPAADTWSSAGGLYERFFSGMAVMDGKLYATTGEDNTYLEDRLDIAVLSGGGGGCSLTCTATVPATAQPGTDVSFSATATASGCTGTTPTYDWDFGDGSAHDTAQNTTHSYAAEGTYTWTMTASIDDQTCTKTGTIDVSSAACSLTCTATVPATTQPGTDVSFSATATASGCTGTTPTYDWDFGDGSAHDTAQNTTHAYAAEGTYTWTMTASIDDQTCTKTGTIDVTTAPAPTVTDIKKGQRRGRPSTFKVKIYGTNFEQGVQVYIGGDTTPWDNVTWKNSGKILLKKGKTLKKKFPKGECVSIRIVNPDGGEVTTGWERGKGGGICTP